MLNVDGSIEKAKALKLQKEIAVMRSREKLREEDDTERDKHMLQEKLTLTAEAVIDSSSAFALYALATLCCTASDAAVPRNGNSSWRWTS